MLALTRKTEYALIAMTHLANRAGETVSAREIAQSSGLPLPILTNILKTLTHAGAVRSTRGANGGYGLAKSIDSITLHELIATIEGPFQLVQCALAGTDEDGKSPCELEPSCPIRTPVYKIHDRLKDFLEGVTLAELMQSSPLIEAIDTGMEAGSPRQPAVREPTE
ncbi:MAG: Rrf2 family transcriptional regulator [Phycisphaerae bacterium]|jgi:Rrf2 family protein